VQEADTESMPQLVGEAFDHDHEAAERDKPMTIFPYGVSRNKIERAILNLRVNASIARNWDDADVVLTLKTLERKPQPKLRQIASDNVPIYTIKTNTTTQIQAALRDVFNLGSIDHEELAIREAEEAIYQVMLTNQAIELSPQTSYVRRSQHQLAERYRLQSRSTGLEPNRRVRISKTAE
jgi:R3H domain